MIVRGYEISELWSQATVPADRHSEKIKDKGLKMRARENHKKAGYDTDSLSKHSKFKDK